MVKRILSVKKEKTLEKVKLSLAPEKCSGCGICRLVCALTNYKRNNPKIAHIKIAAQFPDPGGYKISFKNCRFCGECIKWCPTGALTGAFPESIKKPPLAELMAKPTLEKKLGGYAGRILYVNLTKKKFTARPLPEKLAKEYIGGRGLAAYLLYQKTRRFFTLPLGPENRVVMASGPLSGVFVPAGGKITFASKSPLTKGYGDSNMGGHLSAELKYAGYDAIVIWGKAKKPSVLVIDDDHIELRDGSKYWGKFSMDAEKMLKDDLGEDFQIAVIGPAGENLVHFACVSHDFGRQAGRTGIGAVLGSKNLKAICIRGSKDIPLFDTEAVFTKGKEMFKACLDDPGREIWKYWGTPGVTGWVNDSLGALPVKNFQTEALENCDSITGDRMRKEIVKYDKACGLCPMPCGKWSHAKKDGKYDVLVEGPEYETIALCGSNCGLTDIKDIAYANYLCDQYGIDTISAGGVIAFAMECFEKGIIPKWEVDGHEIKFGDIDSFKLLVEKIAARQGIGKILALGTKRAAQIRDFGSEKFAIQAKGLEWSGYGSRWAPAQMLAYITCDVGAHHNRCWVIG
ncbi:MAG: aldehyde ferredoxin oxidoreductase N-terminal domain-containing protein, partial [bacterium]|nr:aldehyde ferredoxin oxidoreductase N-terminal domain-containing protein [bacterium]